MINMLLHQCSEVKSQEESENKVRVFTLLEENQNDGVIKAKLQETCLLLIASSQVSLQYQGIEIGAILSEFKKDNDPIFALMMKQLCTSKNTEVRKKIIKAIRAPYSAGALAFLGKRLKDNNPAICELIFRQLIATKTEITAFPTKEARMLVITEGITSANQNVRLACIEFLRPTILSKPDDLSYIFKLIDTRLAFTNQYFARIPSVLILAMFEILPTEMDLAHFIGDTLAKLRRIAQANLVEEEDMDLLFGKDRSKGKFTKKQDVEMAEQE